MFGLGTIFTFLRSPLGKYATIAIGVVMLCSLTYCQGRSDGRAAIEAEIAKATLEGTNRADADEQGRREAAENRADANEGAIRNAVRDHPEESNKAAGPATRGVIDELRRRGR